MVPPASRVQLVSRTLHARQVTERKSQLLSWTHGDCAARLPMVADWLVESRGLESLISPAWAAPSCAAACTGLVESERGEQS